MTLKDLQDDVYSLGFETVKQPDEFFINAANRALRIIFADHKYKKTVRIHAPYPDTSLYMPTLSYKAEPVTLPVTGRAYSLHVCGRGSLTVKEEDSEKRLYFDGKDSLLRGFISGEATLCFEGDLPYRIFDLAVYTEIFSDSTDDIPDGGGRISFDFSEYKDFLSFAKHPTDAAGAPIESASITDSRMTIDARRAHDVYVTYNRMPARINSTYPDSEIDIPRAAEPQLALLCASFLWRDSDPELAEHYFELYRDLSAGERETRMPREKYVISDRWA